MAHSAGGGPATGERRLAWLMLSPALGVIALIAMFPLCYAVWESLHRDDLRMPWLGRPFVGLDNYAELLGDGRFWAALAHTGAFAAISIAMELVLGLALAVAMHRVLRGTALVRVAALLPWTIPTVVAGLLWRFLFDSRTGVANAVLGSMGMIDEPIVWLAHTTLAWVPIILADVWKTTPFVALLLLAGLQNIDPVLHEAAAIDGAGWWRRLRHVTLPLLAPALLVALIFRTVDAFRVFDLVYVLTGGGPGTATEPVAPLAFTTMLQHLRFGYGAAIGVMIFVVSAALAMGYVRVLGRAGE